jgi:hypothetical protein
MYHLINENIANVLDTIYRKKDIDPYLKMAEIFNTGRVADNDEYKTTYRKYWQLNAARLSDHYCNHYFQVMEDHRHQHHVDIEDVVKALYEVPSNSKGRKTIQFSFATKLLHTIDNTLPIYDSLVVDFYFLPQIKPSWKYGNKLSAYTRAYNFLLREHKRVLDKRLLSQSIQKFRERFALPSLYSDQKAIDTLLWKFSAYARSGAMMLGKIQYR